jgi:hypothetical protein
MGNLLYDSVINALSKIQFSNNFIHLNTIMESIAFPKKKFSTRKELINNLAYAESIKNNAIENNLSSGEKRLAVTKCQGALIALRISEVLDKLGDINSEIQIFKIGDIEIVGVPVELFVEYGIEIKSKSISPNTIIAGYANEVLGYVYTKDAVESGGYEVYASPFSTEAGEFIVSKVLEMEKALF